MADLLATVAEARSAAFAGRFGDAAAHAREVLAQQPTCLVARRTLAWAQLSLGEAGALESFQSCVAYDPADALARIGQAICLERLGQREAALQQAIQAWELEPHDQLIRRAVVRLGGELPESELAEGISLLAGRRDEAAAEILRRVAASSPGNMAALLALMTALWRLGGLQQAFNLATTVLAAHPHCAKALLPLAAIEARNGRALRARELIARAEAVDPGLVLYADVVREIQLEPVLERFRVRRPSAAIAVP